VQRAGAEAEERRCAVGDARECGADGGEEWTAENGLLTATQAVKERIGN
jgi:hypothetical protein